MTDPTQNDRLAALAARRAQSAAEAGQDLTASRTAQRADAPMERPAADKVTPSEHRPSKRQTGSPSTARLATAGASAVSFAAMVVAMGPLTATADTDASSSAIGESQGSQPGNPPAPDVVFEVSTSVATAGLAADSLPPSIPGDPAAVDPATASTLVGEAPSVPVAAAPAPTTSVARPASGATAAPATAAPATAPPATAPPAPPTAPPATAAPVTAPPTTAAPTTAPPTTAASG